MAAAIPFIAGTAIQVYGQIQGAQAKAGAAATEAAAKQAMAQEVQDRQNLNRETLTMQGDAQIGNQVSQYARGNVDVGSGSPLMTMENTYATVKRKINNDQIEADFRSRMDLLSSANDQNLSNQYSQAGGWNAAGTLLTKGAAALSGNLFGAGGGGSSLITSDGGAGGSEGAFGGIGMRG